MSRRLIWFSMILKIGTELLFTFIACAHLATLSSCLVGVASPWLFSSEKSFSLGVRSGNEVSRNTGQTLGDNPVPTLFSGDIVKNHRARGPYPNRAIRSSLLTLPQFGLGSLPLETKQAHTRRVSLISCLHSLFPSPVPAPLSHRRWKRQRMAGAPGQGRGGWISSRPPAGGAWLVCFLFCLHAAKPMSLALGDHSPTFLLDGRTKLVCGTRGIAHSPSPSQSINWRVVVFSSF